MTQTTLRTDEIIPNENISFPVGTALAVQKYSSKLDFKDIFGHFKRRGIPLAPLTEALLTYRLTENRSTTRASEWINRREVLSQFCIRGFEERTLFRVLEILGANYEEILFLIRKKLFSLYDFPHTNVNLDWTSFVPWGKQAKLGAFGYSRDHRPDKKQIAVGVAELSNPINIPIGMTIMPGNTNDQTHFLKTFRQVKPCLRQGSLLTFDKGGQSKSNLDAILASKMKYMSAKKLNRSDENWIKRFSRKKAKLVDQEQGVYGLKRVYPSRTDYLFFSEKLKGEQIEMKLRRAEQKFMEAKEIQQSIEKHRNLPKRFRINNPLVDVVYRYQTKLPGMTEQEARAIVQVAEINGRGGFFCLISSENLTLAEALKTYRMKDSIEKVFQSMKNDINISPLRVWSTNSINGAILVGFLAQMIISLMRYDHPGIKHTSPKSIKISLSNLTVTVERLQQNAKRFIYSNFEPINGLILARNLAKT